jgi:hypothetical protein
VLVGEQLEVEEEEVKDLIETGDLPESLTLCEAAIVKSSADFSRSTKHGGSVAHTGRLLQR